MNASFQVINKPLPKVNGVMECKISNFDEFMKKNVSSKRRIEIFKVLAENHELPCRWHRNRQTYGLK